MEAYTQDDRERALKVVTSAIRSCEKIQPKFAEGTSQHSLLRNRLSALYIAKGLLEQDAGIQAYGQAELEQAMPPLRSILHKTEKARSKYEAGSTQYKRFSPTVAAMELCTALLEEELARRA